MKHALIVAAAFLVTGCGAGVAEGPAAEAQEITAPTSAPTSPAPNPQLYRVRPDPRECPTPVCGGFWIAPLNTSSAEVYVAAFDFSHSGLAQSEIDSVLAAPADTIVLEGELGPAAATAVPDLEVTGAWLGLPGVASAEDAVYSVTASPLACAACGSLRATLVNTTKVSSTNALSVTPALRPGVQETYVAARVLGHGALVAAAPTSSSAGQQQLVASQVFIRLPDEVGPCPEPSTVTACADGTVPVFTRDENRCLVQTGCVKPAACPLSPILACDPGYRAVSWPAAPSACEVSACDPLFSAKSP